jgi:hypothetical protein
MIIHLLLSLSLMNWLVMSRMDERTALLPLSSHRGNVGHSYDHNDDAAVGVAHRRKAKIDFKKLSSCQVWYSRPILLVLLVKRLVCG